MQAQRHEGDATNQMDTQYHFSQPAYPDMGLGGLAEGGWESGPLEHTILPIPQDLQIPIIDDAHFSMVGGWLPNLSTQSTSLNHGSFLAQAPAQHPSVLGHFPVGNEEYNATWTADYISEPGMASQQPYPYFTQSADMGAMVPGNPFLAHTGDISKWANMDFTDDMLADFPIVAGVSGPVNNNSTPQFLPPVVAPPAAPVAAPIVVAPAAAIVTAPPLATCTFCTKTFVRDSDRTRHENSKHLNIPGAHLCPVLGCIKSHGGGYSRADKLTEHLWKKHSGLGYAKRV
ncbi:hypothetical protein LHYA1_G005827 [Lachnellula hyalina]|uniref:C2H2-type domain-containing protein n=1 Tax=Lachnellula hyalina TaxID=1316788 RepID=A0A8H8R0F4_9HELO|nr:uncharacterized protein LHYA1_G005827 [Lachnellula hyalina]TVY26267.1 hypothetical protein LHYA1_G005827 [Lachnellula hyalina]